MAYDLNPFKAKANESIEWLKKEFGGLRTGRATPAILDVVKVESYGSFMPVSQVAAISVEDARSLRIAPWDSTLIKDIEKSIMLANLGVSTSVDDKGVRVIFPELTTETRALLMKTAKAKLEEARISLRQERDKVMTDVKAKEKASTLTEDDRFRIEKDVQKVIDDSQKKLEELLEKKEKEISA